MSDDKIPCAAEVAKAGSVSVYEVIGDVTVQSGSVGEQAGSMVSPGLYLGIVAKAYTPKQKTPEMIKEFNIANEVFLGQKNLATKREREREREREISIFY